MLPLIADCEDAGGGQPRRYRGSIPPQADGEGTSTRDWLFCSILTQQEINKQHEITTHTHTSAAVSMVSSSSSSSFTLSSRNSYDGANRGGCFRSAFLPPFAAAAAAPCVLSGCGTYHSAMDCCRNASASSGRPCSTRRLASACRHGAHAITGAFQHTSTALCIKIQPSSRSCLCCTHASAARQ